MAHEAKVVWSVNSPCGLRCVDITARPEGGFGWASYRRDPEDPVGWRPEGPGQSGFGSFTAALQAASAETAWIGEVT